MGSYSTKFNYYTLLKQFEDQKLSQNTRSIYTRALHSLWDYFVKEGYVEKNIIEVVDSEEKDPDPIPPEDMATIIRHFRSGSVAHHYWVVYFMLLTGCRPSSAMVQLKEDIDFRRKIITIRNIKAGRRKKKPFYKFPLYDELLSLIQEMGVKEGDTGQLFDMYAVVENNYTWLLSFWDRAMTKLTKETDKEGNKIKKEIARKYILKQLRPTLATFLINILQKDIFTVKKLLDHANIKVTEIHYIYLDLERIRKELGDVSLDSFLSTENYGNGD